MMEAGRLTVAGQLGAWAELVERGPPWRVGVLADPQPAVSGPPSSVIGFFSRGSLAAHMDSRGLVCLGSRVSLFQGALCKHTGML